MKQLRTVIVGLGRIGWQFHMPEVSRHEGYLLEGIVDPLAERRDEAHARFGVVGFADLPTCLAQVSPDLVVIASPTSLHADQAEMAFAAGCNVFTDKHMAPDLASADRMIEAAQQHGRRVMVYQPHCGSREVICLRSILTQELIGDVYLIKHTQTQYTRRDDWQTWQRNGGGMLNNYGAHLIDVCLHVAGSRARRVTCHLRGIATLGDADDVVKAVIETENGMLLDIDINMASAQPMLPSWHVVGAYGSLQLDADTNAWQARFLDPAELPPLQAQDGMAARDRRYESGEQLPWQEASFSLKDVQPLDFYAEAHGYFAGDGEAIVPVAESRELMRVLGACREDSTGL